MSPYYEWNPKKEEFVESLKPSQKKNFPVIYRLAKNSDKNAILDFEMECKKTEPEVYISQYNNLRKELQSISFDRMRNFKVVLALVDNKVVGELSMGWYFNYETNCKVGVIPGLWVLKPYRMAGIGKGLIEFAKEKLKKSGAKRIELIVGLKNLAAREFYRKLGFQIRKVGQVSLEF